MEKEALEILLREALESPKGKEKLGEIMHSHLKRELLLQGEAWKMTPIDPTGLLQDQTEQIMTEIKDTLRPILFPQVCKCVKCGGPRYNPKQEGLCRLCKERTLVP